MISDVKSLKKVYNEQKKVNNGSKSTLASFWVRVAPKSLSKYTTNVVDCKKINVRLRKNALSF